MGAPTSLHIPDPQRAVATAGDTRLAVRSKGAAEHGILVGTVTGTMTGINNDQKSTIEGKIAGNKLTFTRDNAQEYHGYLFVDDPTDKANKQVVAGTFKSGDNHAGWYAKR
jgi:hypothetical protein